MASEHYSQIQPSMLPIRSIDTEQQQPDHTMVDPTPTSPFTSTTTSNGPYNPVPLSSALLASAMSSVDGFNPHAPVFTPAAENIGNSDLVPTSPSPEIDPQILEALRSKDRIYVLKLGEQMESLISERRFRLDLTPATSYQRLLVHRCSAYYRLQPDSDPVSKGISVSTTSDSRIPPRRLADLIPPDSSTPPAFQIMRRSSQNRRPKTHSQAGSVAGDDGDLSDVDESEAGSVGGRSNATGGSSKKRMTIEEREAAYNEARSRIFMNFEEKEKEKEKDMSSSSSLSVVSGSASTSGGSVGDIEDSVSSVATESEWSAPSFRKGRSSASNRSVRSSAHSFSSNGAGSSRNSRAPSPSFAFPSLYEPNTSGIPYDAVQPGPVTTPGYLPANYYYPFVPGQAANSGYLAPYPPYYPYPYSAPPHPHNPSDPSSPPSGEMYAPHPIYHNSYNWAANQQSPPLPPPPPPPHPQSVPPPSTDGANGGNAPQSQGNTQFHPHPYVTTSPVYMYPMPGYYPQPPPGQSMMGPMPLQQPMMNQLYDHRSGDGSQEGGGHFDHNFGRGGYNPNSNSNPNRYSRTATFNGSTTNGKTRANAPQPRHTWSYGPGIGGHNGPSDVGPRFNSTNRRQSNHSSGSSSGNYRSSNNWDEVSSTASSSTSSSSRRTYTSTSSQHPLPPRPDWAVGLKPDPTLHATNRHHESSNGSRSNAHMSPSRCLNGASGLQSADFPPLSSSPTEKRPPVVAGAWTNPPSTRALGQVTSLVQRSPSAANPNRLEETDRFERPPPRAAELYNPKMGPKRSSSNHSAKHSEKEDGIRGRDSGGSALADQVRTLSLEAAPDG